MSRRRRSSPTLAQWMLFLAAWLTIIGVVGTIGAFAYVHLLRFALPGCA